MSYPIVSRPEVAFAELAGVVAHLHVDAPDVAQELVALVKDFGALGAGVGLGA